MLTVGVLVLASQASAFSLFGLLRPHRNQACPPRSGCVAIQAADVSEGTAASYQDDLTEDERRCAELGRGRCRMVRPIHDDVDDHPVCKAWKWNSDDGWHWDWAESNCPWRQQKRPLRYNFD